jgi:hypothetical protein
MTDRLPISDERLLRHKAFWSREPAEIPLVGSWLRGFYVPELYPRVAAALPLGPVNADQIPVEAFLADVEDLFQDYAVLDDDYPFSIGALASVPWMEAIMGCPISYSGTTLWADPCIQDWQDCTWRRPEIGERWLAKLLEMLAALVAASKGRFACSPTLMRGAADMCSAMRTPSRLALDLFDYPDEVSRLAVVCADSLLEVVQAQLALIPESTNGYMVGSAGLRCWMPEKGAWLQDDAMAVLSPRSYRRIFLPEMRRVAGQLPCVAFHLHGNSLWSVDMLVDVPEIDVLELNFDVGGNRLAEDIVPAWARIQDHRPCVAFAQVTHAELEFIRNGLSPTGLSFQTVAATIDEGRAIRGLLQEVHTD